VRDVRASEFTDERGFGKFCVEFSAAGGLLGAVFSGAGRASGSRTTRPEVIAVAEERDRVLGIVTAMLK